MLIVSNGVLMVSNGVYIMRIEDELPSSNRARLAGESRILNVFPMPFCSQICQLAIFDCRRVQHWWFWGCQQPVFRGIWEAAMVMNHFCTSFAQFIRSQAKCVQNPQRRPFGWLRTDFLVQGLWSSPIYWIVEIYIRKLRKKPKPGC